MNGQYLEYVVAHEQAHICRERPLVETPWFPFADDPLVQSSDVAGLCSAVP